MNTSLNLLSFVLLVAGHVCAQVAPAIEWQRSLGGAANEYGNCIELTADGGYIIAGATQSTDQDVTGNHGDYDAWVVKLDDEGEILWQKALGGTGNDGAYAIHPTLEGGYIMAGSTWSNDGDVTGNHGIVDAWVVKLDALGNIQWQRALGGSGFEEASSIRQRPEGGYFMAGTASSWDGDLVGSPGVSNNAWFVKLDTLGNIQWQRVAGGSYAESAYGIDRTGDGGYIAAGFTFSSDGDILGGNHGNGDAWVVKLYDGYIEWETTLGGSAEDRAEKVQQTPDGGFIVCGSTNSEDGDVSGYHGHGDAWVVKLSNLGYISWQKTLGGDGPDNGYDIVQTSDGGYLLTGLSDIGLVNSPVGWDAWVVKLDAAGDLLWQKPMGGSDYDAGSTVRETPDGGSIMLGHSRSSDGDVSGSLGGQDIWVVKLGSDAVGIPRPEVCPILVTVSREYVRISSPISLDDARMTLVDVAGRTILTSLLEGTICTLDMRDRPRGLYMVSVQHTGGISSSRFVLE